MTNPCPSPASEPHNPVHVRLRDLPAPVQAVTPLEQPEGNSLAARRLFLVTGTTAQVEAWAEQLNAGLERERSGAGDPCKDAGPALGNCLDWLGLAVNGGVRIAPVNDLDFPGDDSESNLWGQRLLVVIDEHPQPAQAYASFDLVWESNKHGVGPEDTSLTVNLLEVWARPERRGTGLGAALMAGAVGALQQSVEALRKHLAGVRADVPVRVCFTADERNPAGDAMLRKLSQLAREAFAVSPQPEKQPRLELQGWDVKSVG